jgi:hypothetical protein
MLANPPLTKHLHLRIIPKTKDMGIHVSASRELAQALIMFISFRGNRKKSSSSVDFCFINFLIRTT